MAAETGSGGTLGDLLAVRRRRRFVGRAGEVELFRTQLGSPAPVGAALLFFHGPAGIGKTSLLEVLAGVAAETDVDVVSLDARDLPSSPAAVLEALRSQHLEVPDGDAPITAPRRLILLVDSYERLAPLDDWIRTRLLPRLPATALTVIAGRHAPGPSWRADPAWRDGLRVVSLRNLDSEESREYLAGCGVDAADHDALFAATHGHPLGLSLVADVAARGGSPAAEPLDQDVVGTLLQRFIEVVPSGLHRRALEVCALARVTTEGLLREALEVADAHDLFAWLRQLSFVNSGPDGLFPHDLARDALDADLRWRDPDGYRRVFRAVRAHTYTHLKTLQGHEQRRAIFDLKFVFRNVQSVLSPVDWESWGWQHPEPARPQHRDTLLALIEAAEGPESATIARRWWQQQPGGFAVVRGDDDTIRGVVGILDLTAASADDVTADPGAQAAMRYAAQHAPNRPGEVVTQTRFVIDRDAYQGPSPTLNAVPVVTIQRFLHTANRAWDFLTLAEPEPWDDYFALADMPRARDADFVVGGRRYGLFAHDFRAVSIDALMELWTERALAQDLTPETARAPEVLVLSQPEFVDAARQALRDLHRPDLLARNPLAGTRLARDRARSSEVDGSVLAGLVHDAIATLRRHPRDDKLLRAVEATYVRPAASQEAVANRLGLPFSTYRRHLTRGIERVVAWLWEREVYGPE